MLEEVRTAVATLERVAGGFEPRCLDGPAAAKLVKLVARGKHMLGAIEALAAKRVDETGAYRASGARSAGHWLAQTTGAPVAAAFKVLETVEALDELPATNDAFRAGRLSAEQAHEIAGAAAKDPGAEHELLGAARGTSLKGLRDRCRLVRANAEADDAAWAERLRASRSMPLHALMTRGPRKATAATLVIDEAVPARGYALPGERCEITGMGPSPVTIAKAMFEDAKVRTVPRDPAALPEHSSDSRYYPAWLTAWLDAKYPVCGAKGCDADFRLQYDHVIAMEDGGRTERDNLWRLCPHHHDLKTNYGWRVTGTTHSWDLEPPDDPDPP